MVSLKCGFLKKSFIINDFLRNPHFNYQPQISNFCNFFQPICFNENSNDKINFRKFRDSALKIRETMCWAAQFTWFSFLDILTDFLLITKLGSISNIDIFRQHTQTFTLILLGIFFSAIYIYFTLITVCGLPKININRLRGPI